MKKIGYVAVAVLLLVAGCSSSQENKLVGRWQEKNNPQGVLVFLSNHKGDAYWPGDKGKQESSPMNWSIIKGQNMVTVLTPPGPVNFEIKGNHLMAPNGIILTKVE